MVPPHNTGGDTMNFELTPYSSGTNHAKPWETPRKQFSQTVLVDSRDRDADLYPNPNSYRIKLPSVLRNVTSARLVSAEIPAMFYVFSADRGNTQLRVSVAGGSPEEHTITIPDGNYTANTMALAIQTALNTTFTGTTFTVSLDQTTMRYTITNNDSIPIAIRCNEGADGVSTGTYTWGLGYYLGFEKTVLEGPAGTVTAPGILNLRPESYILLRIRDLDTVYQTGSDKRHSFAKIPFSVSSFGINFFDKLLTDNIFNPTKERLEWLDIELVFYDDSPVQFVGSGEHSFTLEFWTNNSTL